MSKKVLKLSSLLIVTSLILSACTNGGATENTDKTDSLPQVKVMEVSFDGEQSFTLNGEVTAGQSATLTAEFKANVRSVFVKPGDFITQNTVLALLSSDSIEQSYQTAQQNLNNTQQSLNQTYTSTSKSIEAARVALESAESSYNNLITQNKISRQQAKDALESTKLNLDLSTKTASDTLENTINSISVNVQTAINSADAILGVSEIYKDTAKTWKNNLGTLKLETKANAESSLKQIINDFENYAPSYESSKTLLEETGTMLQNTLTMLQNSTTGNNYSQTSLNTDISTITNKISSIQGLLTSLTSANNNLQNILQSNEGKSQSLINAEAQYDATITQLNSSEEASQKQVESARVSLEATKQNAELSLLSAKSALTNAQGNFEQAKINYEKLMIKAPFSGTILDIPIKTGNEISLGQTLAQIENDSLLKIIAYVTPAQAKKLKVGDLVKIGKQSEDKISAISGSVDPATKKHKVEILHQNQYLHSGQTVPLVFTTNKSEKENIIFIPLTAVHVTSSESYVWTVDENMQTKKKEITTGEINGSQIKIDSGLEEGDKIIVEGGRLLKKAGEVVKVSK